MGMGSAPFGDVRGVALVRRTDEGSDTTKHPANFQSRYSSPGATLQNARRRGARIARREAYPSVRRTDEG
jgi:hypothetical protein